MRTCLIVLAAAAVAAPAGALAQNRRYYSDQQQQEAIRACRSAVQDHAARDFGGNSIEFRDAHWDADGDAVIGLVDIPRGNYEEHMRFTCSMDFDRDEVRSVRFSPISGGTGYRERSAEGPDRAMDNCRSAVAGRIEGQGYGGVQFNAARVDQRNQRISGRARAQRGGYWESFNYSCAVELRDGDLRSVNVTRR
ncbi:MAG: hypothetical protein LAQ30_12955 [Acidobacteriia bacterium]|nr:hypothetical protein [Terriglobia bacterium]